MLRLEPRNKHLLIEAVKNDTKEEKVSEFFGASSKKPDNLIYRLLDRADDCVVPICIGQLIVVEGNMVQENKVGDQTFLTCKENFVIGIVKD